MRRNRTIAVLLALCLTLSLLPPPVRAAEAYTLQDGVLTVSADWDPDTLPEADKATVTSLHIGPDAAKLQFDGLYLSDYPNLAAITVDAGNGSYSARDGVLLSADGTMLFCYPAAKSGDWYLPPRTVTGLGPYSFARSSPLTLYLRAEQRTAIEENAKHFAKGYAPDSSVTVADYCDTLSVAVEQNGAAADALTLVHGDAVLGSAALSASVGFDGSPDAAFLSRFDAVTWTSSDPSVATVDESGLVTAVGGGTAVITATSVGVDAADEAVSDSCAVTVLVPAQSITPTAGEDAGTEQAPVPADSNEGGRVLSVQLDADATERSVTFTSSDPSVAALTPVDDEEEPSGGSGTPAASLTVTAGEDNVASVRVVPLGTGAVTVTATAGSASLPFYLNFTAWVDGVSLDTTALDLAAGEDAVLTAAVSPDNATDKSVAWSVSEVDPQNPVLTLTDNGDGTAALRALRGGTATVTVTTNDQSKTASCALRVWELTLSASALALDVHGAETLTATLTPETAERSAFAWEISDPFVASVDQNGLVTARAAGTADVTVSTTIDGKTYRASCPVTVSRVPVSAVSVEPDSVILTYGGLPSAASQTVRATVSAENATPSNGAVIWSSGNSAVVAVTPGENGEATLTAAGGGVTTVTATAADGSGCYGVCQVTVYVPATGVTLDKTAVTLPAGGTEPLLASVLPALAEQRVAWTSSDEAVATVDQNGLVTAAGPGSATVTAVSAGFTATCAVTVTRASGGVTLAGDTALHVDTNPTGTLTATVTPADATDTVVWSSSNTGVLRVSAGGDRGRVATLTAVSAGTVTVTAVSGGESASVTVTVSDTPVTALTLSPTTRTLALGETLALTATVSPADSTLRTVTWAADSANVTLSQSSSTLTAENGAATSTVRVTGAAVGSVNVTASIGGLSAACAVTVVSPAESVTLNRTDAELKLGGENTQVQLTATVLPAGTTDSVVWSSSDESVATVDQSGLVTASHRGTARITARSGGAEAVCAVTVKQLVTSVTIPDSLSVQVGAGRSRQLSALVLPEDANNAGLVWTSGDESVATVSGGVVTGLAAGTVTVTATAADGSGVYGTCTVTVTAPAVTGVSLDKTALTGLKKSDAATLTATVAPADAANANLSWSVSGDAVSVAANGAAATVTALRPGTATVTVTTADGGFTASCAVTVDTVPVGSVAISPNGGTIDLQSASPILTLTASVGPDNVTDPGLAWSSSDESVAIVSGNPDGSARVTGVDPGSAVITAEATDGSHVRASCAVTVTAASVTGVTLSRSRLTLTLGGGTEQLAATVSPFNAWNKAVTWSSDAPAIASVDQNGVVTPVAKGEAAVITVTTADGGFAKSCVVDVTQPVQGITLSGSGNLTVGDSAALTAAVAPADANDKSLTWLSSDPAVATVDQSGTVTALAAGDATITATAKDGSGVSGSFALHVSATAVTGVSISQSAYLAKPGGQRKLSAAVSPDDATDKAIVWSSSDPAVATVDESGLVTAVAAGSATITAAAHADAAKSAACAVTVKEGVQSVVLSGDGSLSVDDTAVVNVSLTPADPYDPTLTWISSDESVVTVTGDSSSATVTAVGPGSATVTAIAADGGKSGSLRFTVTRAATAIALDGAPDLDLSDPNRHYATLTATLTPGNATDTVVWSVEGGAVQLIGGPTVGGVSTATVVAHSGGSATITAAASSNPTTVHATRNVSLDTPTAGVTLSESVLTLTKGTQETLTATVTPAGATDQSVSWTSSNPLVATVAGGTVTALSAGQTIVTATASGGQTAQCAVTVQRALVTSVTLSESAATLLAGDTEALTATVGPDDAEDKSLVWTSSNPAVATVDGGTVTAHAVGTAVVTATAADGSGKYGSCAVTVRPTEVASVTLSEGDIELNVNGDATAQLHAAVAGESGKTPTDGTLRWMSSSPARVSVDENGLVTALSAGSAVITVWARSDDSKRASVTVTALAPVTGVTVPGGSRALTAGDSVTLSASVSPDNAGDKTVTWQSSDTDVATVDANGLVTAVAAGTATVTATSVSDNTKAGSVTVTVTAAVTGVSIDGDESFVLYTTGESSETSRALAATVAGGSSAVTWTSSNSAVATVDANGLVAAAGAGVAVISVRTDEGGKTDSCVVTVKEHPAAVTLDRSTLALNAGDSAVLTATVAPAGAENKAVTWSSSDTDVATVRNGVVTAVSAGSATVTVTTVDGGRTASCTVTVSSTLTSVGIYAGGSAAGSVELNMLTAPSVSLRAVTNLPALPNGATVAWTSSNSAVATVTDAQADTLVEGVGPGTAQLTATVTYAGESVSATCTVTVTLAEVSADKDTLVLLPGALSGSVTFSGWGGGVDLSISDAAFLQRSVSDNSAAHTRTYTFTAVGNGTAILNWTAAPGSVSPATHASASGTLTVTALAEPLESVSVNALSDGALTASLDTADSGSYAGTIRVSGYRTGTPDDTWLTGKLSYTPYAGLTCAEAFTDASSGTLTVLRDSETVAVYQIVCNVVSLPETVTVNTALVSQNGQSGSIDLSSATVTGVEAGMTALQSAGVAVEQNATVNFSVNLSVQGEATAGGYRAVRLDVTPTYTVTENDAVTASGTLSKFDSAVTLTVQTTFAPALVVHYHNGTPEYIVPHVTGPDGSGLYTVTWQQSSFSPVELRAALRSGYLAFDRCDGTVETRRYDETMLGADLPAGEWVAGGETVATLTEALLSAIDGSTESAPVAVLLAGATPQAAYSYRDGVLTVTGGTEDGEILYAAAYDAKGRMTALVPVTPHQGVRIAGASVKLLRLLPDGSPKAPSLPITTK